MTRQEADNDRALARLCLALGDTLAQNLPLREYPLITTQPGSEGHALLGALRDRGYVVLARSPRSFSTPAIWRVTKPGVAAAKHYTARCAHAD